MRQHAHGGQLTREQQASTERVWMECCDTCPISGCPLQLGLEAQDGCERGACAALRQLRRPQAVKREFHEQSREGNCTSDAQSSRGGDCIGGRQSKEGYCTGDRQ
jgi:hypothetical protein